MPLYQSPERRWLALYSTDFVALADAAAKPAAASPPSSPPSPPPLPPAVSTLPDAVLRSILRRLDAEGLSAAAQVCRGWRAVAYEPAAWRAQAARAWPLESPAAVERLLWFGAPPAPYGTWRRLVTRRPRVRASGVYVRRHHYVKSRRGVCLDGEPAPAVSLVTYWRMLRFYSDGTLVSLVTPERPDKAVRRLRLNWEPQPHESAKAHPSVGSWTFSEDTRTVEMTLPVVNKAFPDAMRGAQHMTMVLASTHAGAHNRLYLRSHFAVFEDGELQEYNKDDSTDSPWRFVRLHGFSRRVYEHFPPESNLDNGTLGAWDAMEAQLRGGDPDGRLP